MKKEEVEILVSENGAKYFIGNPCEKGHVERRWPSRNCIECQKIRQQDYSTTEKKKTRVLNNAKINAKKKGREFSIAAEDIDIPLKCPVLGIPLEFGGKQRDCSASIDRIDSSKGYIKGNVQVISWKANNLKGSATLEELRLMVKYLENL